MGANKKTLSKLILVDAYALFNRAFYALPGFTTADGQPTGALYGFASMLLKLLADERPTYVAVAFDRSGPTFRHEVFSGYKGTRGPMPDDLRAQLPLLRELVEAMNLPIYELDRYEADDVLGTIAKQGEQAGFLVTIVTGDKDVLQLITPRTDAVITRRGISEMDRFTVETVVEQFGVPPEAVVDFKGLTGDTSDNIPGVPGIGPKTAERLLRQYGTVENLLAHVHEVKGKAGRALEEHAEVALLSKQLATIKTDLPLVVDWDGARFHSPVSPELMELMRRLEFARLIEEVEKRFHADIATLDAGSDATDVPIVSEIVGPETLESWVEAWHEYRGDALVQAIPFGGEAWRSPQFALLVARHEVDSAVRVTVLPLAHLAAQCPSLPSLMDRVWSTPDVRWIAHDSKNVMLCLKQVGANEPKFTDDLMLASYLLSPGQGDHSPSDVALKYVHESVGINNVPIEDGTSAWTSVAETGGRVSEALIRAEAHIMPRLKDAGVDHVYRTLEMALVPVLTEMEYRGIALDVTYLRTMSQEMELQLHVLTQRIYEMAGEEFNINSPRQLAGILFEQLGLPVKKKTKSGPSTDAEVLEELAEEHEIVATILDFRQATKLKGTYVDALPALLDPTTQRVHTTFKQAVTATGRLSSAHPNLQNIPVRTDAGRQIRRAFIPGEREYVIVSADYSQIELRVLAHASQDETMQAAFLADVDIHTKTAAEIFNVPMSAVQSSMRDAAKAVNFGIVYGISSFGLARGTGFTRAEAQSYIDAYFERYPKVKAYMQQCVALARETGYAETIFGRKRWIPSIHSRNWAQRSFAERAAMNTPIQGSAADIIKAAMIRTHGLIRDEQLRASLLLQVHDELLLEVHQDDLLRVAQVVRVGMEEAVPLSVPLRVHVMAGPNWLETKEVSARA